MFDGHGVLPDFVGAKLSAIGAHCDPAILACLSPEIAGTCEHFIAWSHGPDFRAKFGRVIRLNKTPGEKTS
jgi:hypothetical protein